MEKWNDVQVFDVVNQYAISDESERVGALAEYRRTGAHPDYMFLTKHSDAPLWCESSEEWDLDAEGTTYLEPEGIDWEGFQGSK
jgi:hypothetical protein